MERVQQSHGFQFWDSNHIFLYLLREWNGGHISFKWTRTLCTAPLLPCGQVYICEAPLPLWIQEQHHRGLMGMKHSLWGSQSAQPLSPSCGRTPQIWHPWPEGREACSSYLSLYLSPGHSGGQDQWVTWRNPGNKRWGYKCMFWVYKSLELPFSWGLVFRIHREVDQLALWLCWGSYPKRKHQNNTRVAIR